MESIFLLIPLSLMLFVVAIWAIRYAIKTNQFEDLDNASQRIILDDRQERRQAQNTPPTSSSNKITPRSSSEQHLSEHITSQSSQSDQP